MTTAIEAVPKAPRPTMLARDVAMRLAAEEYDLVLQLLRALSPEDWSKSTECEGWDVHALVGHMLGMAEMSSSLPEQARQMLAAKRAGGVFIDALTALQVAKHRDHTPGQLVERWAAIGPKAVKGRRRTPGFVRRRTMPVPQPVGGVDEDWTLGFLVDVILTRDPWMHRSDLSRAVGRPMVLTAQHDGVLVDDVVREWAGRHGASCRLELGGPAGGSWTFGDGGPLLELDAVEFCRIVSGRGPATGLLCHQVPF
jgi:uncharacterized protein (TIGR03083 family)